MVDQEYKEAYVKAYKDKHAELVAANLLAPNEMLSTNQEDEILNSLQNVHQYIPMVLLAQ